MATTGSSAAAATTARNASIVLCFGALALGISEFASMGLLPDMAASSHVSIPQAGAAISAYALGVVVGAPLLSLCAARVPRRRLLIGLAVLIAVSNALTAIAPGFPALLVARLLSGLPHGAFLGTATLVASSLAPRGKRASAVGRVLLGLSIANVLGVPLATWLGQVANWRIVFALVAAMALLTAVGIRYFVPVLAAGSADGIGRELRGILRPQVLLALATAAIGFGGMFAIYSYFAPAVTGVTHAPDWVVPLLLMVFGTGMMAGSLAGGWLADRGVMRAILVMLVLGSIAQFCYLFSLHHLVALTVNVFLIGATSMGITPALQTRLFDAAPDAQLLAGSLNHSAFNLANALGAWLGGVVIAGGFGWAATGPLGACLTLGGLAIFSLAWWLEHTGRARA